MVKKKTKKVSIVEKRLLEPLKEISVEPDYTIEQKAIQSLFGDGDKIWGTEGKPVKIYNDLNPRQRGDFGTAKLFGLR